MKSNLIKEYSDYSMNILDELSEKHVSSEVNLFNFINLNNVDYEVLNWLRLVRNDWERSGNPLHINNFHFC